MFALGVSGNSWIRVAWKVLRRRKEIVTCTECNTIFYRNSGWEHNDFPSVILCTLCLHAWKVMMRAYHKRQRFREKFKDIKRKKSTQSEFIEKTQLSKNRAKERYKKRLRKTVQKNRKARKVREEFKAAINKENSISVYEQLMIDAYGEEEWARRKTVREKKSIHATTKLSGRYQKRKRKTSTLVERYKQGVATGQLVLTAADRMVATAITNLGADAYFSNIRDELSNVFPVSSVKNAKKNMYRTLWRFKQAGIVSWHDEEWENRPPRLPLRRHYKMIVPYI